MSDFSQEEHLIKALYCTTIMFTYSTARSLWYTFFSLPRGFDIVRKCLAWSGFTCQVKRLEIFHRCCHLAAEYIRSSNPNGSWQKVRHSLYQQSFKALYYPYARCTNENTLKRAILLFDEVWFVDPASQEMREGLIADQQVQGSITEEWKRVRESYGLLIDKRIVKLYDPEKLIIENDQMLSNALKADLNDNEIWKLCTAPGTPVMWSILRRKVPPSAFTFLQPQVELRITSLTERARAVFYGKSRKEFHIPKNETDPFNIPHGDYLRYTFHDGKVTLERYMNEKERLDVEYSCEFPFTHGSSLIVNEALVIADANGLVPLTDSLLHHQLLKIKYQRAIKDFKSQHVTTISGVQRLDPEKLRRVALTLFDSIIPEHLLARISIGDAIKFRDESKDAFGRLKLYLAELTSQIESEVWDEKFETEIRKMINEKILPEARHAQDDAVEIYGKLFGSITKRAITFLTPTMGASVFAGLTFPQMLLVGSASVIGAVAPDVIDTFLEQKKTQRNSLAYLFNVRHRFQKKGDE